MPGRRHHSKTSTGCTACKARHVKCDEARPLCKGCVRRSTECIYTVDKAASQKSSPAPAPSPNGVLTSTSTADSFDWLDLELMHRWTLETSLNLIPAPSAQQYWQREVPIMAETYPVLRHGMLAIAAMDLAVQALSPFDSKIPPDKTAIAIAAKYRARALHHQQTSLPLFQELLKLRQHAKENNVAFLFGTFLVIIAFASVHATEVKPSLSDLMDIFALFRGPRALWEINREPDNEAQMETLFPGSRQTFRAVFHNNSLDSSRWPELNALDLDDVCADTYLKLKRSYWASELGPGDIRAMGYFPATVSEEFCQQVRERRSHAILILRRFAEILQGYRERWWIGPWYTRLLDAIDADT